MKKFAMIHDENLCIGCQACSVACRNEHIVPDGNFRLQVRGMIKGEFPRLQTNFERHSCVMCDDAPCVEVCPTHASFKIENGITMVDPRTCVGCKYCILACPYDARFVNPVNGNIEKCTFCFETRGGETPACVSVCPTDALIFGDLNDPESDIVKFVSKNVIELPKEHLGTKPNLGFVKNYKGGRHE